jgi:multisubunit Na+/H+ antiporter MnhB subunit
VRPTEGDELNWTKIGERLRAKLLRVIEPGRYTRPEGWLLKTFYAVVLAAAALGLLCVLIRAWNDGGWSLVAAAVCFGPFLIIYLLMGVDALAERWAARSFWGSILLGLIEGVALYEGMALLLWWENAVGERYKAWLRGERKKEPRW